MQRIVGSALKQSSRCFRRFVETEAKAASETVQATTAKAAQATASQTTAAAEKVAPKVAEAAKAPKAPKGAQGPKQKGTQQKKKGKTTRLLIDTALIVACAGGIVRYHNNNDHLSCISKGKGGDGKDLREMLFLVPKNLEDQYDGYMYNSYCDRLIYKLVHENPMHFECMGDVINFFSSWFSTLGIEVDMKAPLNEDGLMEMLVEFSKQENMFNLFIIGERYFGVSPMTEFATGAATRFFNSQRVNKDGKIMIPMEKVIDFVKELEKSNGETYYDSAFIPNFANKLISKRDREVKPAKLVGALENDKRAGMEVYEFVNLLGVIERQKKNKKFHYYLDNYVERKINESLFDNLQRENEPEEEPVEEEIPEVTTEAEEVTEEVEEAAAEAEVETAEETAEEQKVEPEEATLESLLEDLDNVHSKQWKRLIKGDFSGLQVVLEEERTIRKQLNDKDWWYKSFLQTQNTQISYSSFSMLKYFSL